MLLPELWDLLRCWHTHPPVHIMLLPFWHYFCGVEDSTSATPPARPAQPTRSTAEDAQALRSLTSGNVKGFDQLPLAMQARLTAIKKQKEQSHGA